MTSRRVRIRAVAIACAIAAVAGCGRGDPEPGPRAAAPSEPTSQQFGEFELHYNAVRTDMLGPEVARAYGITRSANRVLLNVSVLRRNPDGTTMPTDATVSASAYNLNGQLKQLTLRRISEDGAVYFIGEVGISGTEILVFDIAAVPAGQSSKFEVQFKREFYAG